VVWKQRRYVLSRGLARHLWLVLLCSPPSKHPGHQEQSVDQVRHFALRARKPKIWSSIFSQSLCRNYFIHRSDNHDINENDDKNHDFDQCDKSPGNHSINENDNLDGGPHHHSSRSDDVHGNCTGARNFNDYQGGSHNHKGRIATGHNSTIDHSSASDKYDRRSSINHFKGNCFASDNDNDNDNPSLRNIRLLNCLNEGDHVNSGLYVATDLHAACPNDNNIGR
jgi:hypothetical protein